VDGGGFVFDGEGGDGDADGFGDDEAAEAVGVGQEDGEFLAAETGDVVAGAGDVGGDGAGDLFQAFVAGQVAVKVVVVFEEVDIDDDDGKFAAVAQGAAPFGGKTGVEVAAAGDAGEAVDGGDAAEFAVAALQFVAEVVDGVLVFEDAAADGEPAAQFDRLDGLGDIVVGAGFEAAGDVFLAAALADEEDDVELAGGLLFLERGAQFGAAVFASQDDDHGPGLALEGLPGFLACGDGRFVAPLTEQRRQFGMGCRFVDDHHFHPSFRLCVKITA